MAAAVCLRTPVIGMRVSTEKNFFFFSPPPPPGSVSGASGCFDIGTGDEAVIARSGHRDSRSTPRSAGENTHRRGRTVGRSPARVVDRAGWRRPRRHLRWERGSGTPSWSGAAPERSGFFFFFFFFFFFWVHRIRRDSAAVRDVLSRFAAVVFDGSGLARLGLPWSRVSKDISPVIFGNNLSRRSPSHLREHAARSRLPRTARAARRALSRSRLRRYLVELDVIALGDAPRDDVGLGQPLAEVGQPELSKLDSHDSTPISAIGVTEHALDAVQDAVEVGHMMPFEFPRRIRDVVAGHAHRRGLEIVETALGDRRGDLGAEPPAAWGASCTRQFGPCGAPTPRRGRGRGARGT